jgi:hypothetical protein
MTGPVSATIPVHPPNWSGSKAARRYQVKAHVDAGPRDAGYEVEPEARGRGQVPFDDRGKGIDVVEVGIVVSEEEGQERLELWVIKRPGTSDTSQTVNDKTVGDEKSKQSHKVDAVSNP